MSKMDVIITWLGENEDFEGAPTEPRLAVAVPSASWEDALADDADCAAAAAADRSTSQEREGSPPESAEAEQARSR